MRRGHVLAVSSATLFLSTLLAPCHAPCPESAATASEALAQGVLIVEFYPCGLCDDEYFVLENLGVDEVDLHDWSVTDGEGTLGFIMSFELLAGSRLAVSSNSTSYERAYSESPDIGLDKQDSACVVSLSGTFRLADVGDSLSVRDDTGIEVDFVCYGSCEERSTRWTGDPMPALRKGEVAKRIRTDGLYRDSDSMADWMHFREHRYGYTEFAPLTAAVGPGSVTAFVSPDCGLQAVTSAIRSASRSVRLCAYELSSAHVCDALISAMGLGVKVEVLVDGAPAGGMDDDQVTCLSALAGSGATVRVIAGNATGDTVQHVGPLHAKYIVIDSARIVVLSENFVESGLPSDPLSGNRGWGLSVASPELATYLASVFDEDSRSSRPDVLDWRCDPRFHPGAAPEMSPLPSAAAGIMGCFVTSSQSAVTLFISPDASPEEPFLCDIMRSSGSLLIEQFQADLHWKDRWTQDEEVSPVVSAAVEALGAGAEVSLLLDSVWFNLEKNSEVAAHLNSLASSKNLPGECRLMDTSGPVSTLHNKGLVSDGTTAVVSSNNWGHSSFARNRELAVMVRSEEIASYFTSVFELDWEPDRVAPMACAGPDIELSVGESVVVDGSGSADDRYIARWEWRLEGEGLLTTQGDRAVFFASRPGEHRVHLLVQDAWGNTAVDSVRVRVLPVAEPGQESGPWLLPVALSLGLLSSGAGAALARKVNHRNRAFR